LSKAYTALYIAQGNLNTAASGSDSGAIDNLRKAVDAARSDLSAKLAAWEDASEDLVKWQISQPGQGITPPLPALRMNF
jgi:hypothetical protein